MMFCVYRNSMVLFRQRCVIIVRSFGRIRFNPGHNIRPILRVEWVMKLNMRSHIRPILRVERVVKLNTGCHVKPFERVVKFIWRPVSVHNHIVIIVRNFSRFNQMPDQRYNKNSAYQQEN